jgi:hypothetical protein
MEDNGNSTACCVKLADALMSMACMDLQLQRQTRKLGDFKKTNAKSFECFRRTWGKQR